MSLSLLVRHFGASPLRLAAVMVMALALGWASAARAGPSLAIDAETGQVILAEDAGEPWYPASLTKLMTAYLTFDALRAGRLKLDQKIAVSAIAAKVQPSKIGLAAGSTVSVDFALTSLLVYSANDMAVVLAEAVGGTVPEFVARMNAAAARLGMTGSHFANPHGLYDSRQVTTARDIALLALTIQNEFPQHRHYFSEPFVKVGKKRLRNRNMLLRQMASADGMKTGYICNSGFNLVASATIDNHRYIAVVFGAKTAKGRADIAQVLLESAAARRGRYAGAAQLIQIPDHIAAAPGDMSDVVCKGRDRVAWAKPSQLEGWGASFGRFADANAADALLAGRLATTRDLFSGGDAGVVRVPGSKEVVALVWSLRQQETLSLCSYLRQANAHCEVIPPEAFAEFARQAGADDKPAAKHKKGKAFDKK
jgi:D-alanyl-D-alanine carboxypeptidase